MPIPAALPTGYGTFCWNQLNTPDPARSRAFYEALLGWSIRSETVSGVAMDLISRGADMVGSMMPLPPGVEAPAHWLPYAWVKHLEETLDTARAQGARVVLPPTPVTEAGRIAVILDPRNCALGLHDSTGPEEATRPGGPGTFCWHENLSRDVEGQKAFYGTLLGWTYTAGFMGGGLVYHHVQRGADPIGGMMAMEGDMWNGVPDHWMTYVDVADIEATAARAAELGGAVCVPVTAIEVGRFAVLQDPLGAVFSVFQGK